MGLRGGDQLRLERRPEITPETFLALPPHVLVRAQVASDDRIARVGDRVRDGGSVERRKEVGGGACVSWGKRVKVVGDVNHRPGEFSSRSYHRAGGRKEVGRECVKD